VGDVQAAQAGRGAGEHVAATWERICSILGKRLKLTEARRKQVSGAIREIGVEGVLLIAEWSKNSDHPRAVHNRKGGFDTPDTFLRASKRGEYLDWAREWSVAPRKGLNGVTPDRAWSIVLLALEAGRWKAPAEWHPNPEVHKAIHTCYRASGGASGIGRCNEYQLKSVESQFKSMFAEVYHG